MKIKISRNEFNNTLNSVMGVIPSRSTKPILSNVQIIGDDNGITICGSDLEISISSYIEVDEIIEPCTVLLPARTLSGIISEDKSDYITLEVIDEKATIKTDKGKFKLTAASGDDFPEMKNTQDDSYFEVAGDALAHAISKTEFATAKGDTRYALNGICLNIIGDTIEFASSDTHRLSKVVKKLESCEGIEGKFIAITKGMKELAKLAAGEELVKVNISDNELIAKTSSSTLSTRLVEGQFPNYDNVIPSESNTSINIIKNDIISGLKLVGKMSNDESNSVKFVTSDNKLDLSANTGSRGSGKQTYDIKIDGVDVDTSFNYNYMVDALKSFNSSSVVMDFKDNSTPVRINEGDYTHIVMPITNK